MLQLNKIHNGNWIELAEQLDDESVDLIITSPPYWGLRDYGVEGQIGLEEHPNEYIKRLVDGFRILKKKLKKTGSFYLNLGDTYFGGGGSSGHTDETTNLGRTTISYGATAGHTLKLKKSNWLQPKQLMLMPSRVAIALQEDGWILRNDNIWHKPNPMPSSVKDRLNTTYEHIFHFVKSRKYYYDLDAIREPHSQESLNDLIRRKSMRFIVNKDVKTAQKGLKIGDGGDRLNRTRDEFFNEKGKNPGDVLLTPKERENPEILKYSVRLGLRKNEKKYQETGIRGNELGKNPGDFWSINTQPFPASHFAVFPEEICIKPIKSSCPKEICKKCGFIRERIVESNGSAGFSEKEYKKWEKKTGIISKDRGNRATLGLKAKGSVYYTGKTKGFTKCNCNVGFKPGIVLDPFAGSGTALLVAKKLKRNYLGFELSQEYIKIAEMRLRGCKGWQFKEVKNNKSLKDY